MVDMGFHRLAVTVIADLRCFPGVGDLPLTVTFSAFLRNACGTARRVAAALDLVTAAGPSFATWRQGWADIPGGGEREAQWTIDIPALHALHGLNRVRLAAIDVTPPPFNNPPCPSAGHSAAVDCWFIGW
jgi:hypothetical protein